MQFVQRPVSAERRTAASVSRRVMLRSGAAFLLAPTFLRAQALNPHANVADLDHTTILAQARAAAQLPVEPPLAPVFSSEIEPVLSTAGLGTAPALQRDAARALERFSATIAALTAGFLLTHDDAFAARAVAHLQPWLLQPATRLQPSFDRAGLAPGTTTATPAGVVNLLPLAEAVRALAFLTDALAPGDLTSLQTWCTDAQHWLGDNREAVIAREAKDHRASAWLLLSTSLARFTRDDAALEANRHRFHTHTLRNQIRADGVFPQEVATPNPYRNTLFNFDLLAGACQLLSSPFDLTWDYELIDGVGLRVVAAYLYPVITHPERWGFPADAHFFRDLPGRRPGLVFAGRAYNRPEYVEAWLTAQPAAPPEAIAYSFPIRQPALWTAKAPHGL